MIKIENLHLNIAEKEILKGVDLHLQPGDVYGLLGPNGAGKSTTILALLGLRKYTSGHVSVLGHDPAHQAAEIRRSIGVMAENSGFYDWMTPITYLQWYGHLYNLPVDRLKPHNLLERVGLESVANHPIGTFSRGMKQRLAVARALLPEPRLLILDEPTNGLDPKGRREIHDLLLEFAAKPDTGVLLCTHLLDDVDRLCDRIGILDQGYTRLEGTPAELQANLQTGQRFRLRLYSRPDNSTLPEGVELISHEGDWWWVKVDSVLPADFAALWSELWQLGWQIQEIRSEAASLEEIYIENTGLSQSKVKESTQ